MKGLKLLSTIMVIGLWLTGCVDQVDGTFHVEAIQYPEPKNIQPVVISVLHNFDDPGSLEWIQVSLDAYSEKNKNIVFDVTGVSPENYANVLHQKYASGEMPDIYFLENIYDNLLFIKSGFAMDLSNEPFMRENFISGALEGISYQGGLWAVPIEWNGYGVIYNKKIFNSYDINQVPKTYDDFLEVCEVLIRRGYDPITGGFREKEAIINDLYADVNQSSYSNNTDWRLSIENDLYFWEDNFFRFTDALNRMSQRLAYYDEDIYNLNLQEATEKVAFDRAVMILGDFDTLDEVTAHNPDAQIGMFAFPWSDDVNKVNFPIKTIGGLVANPKSKNKTYLVDLMAHLSSVEVGEYAQLYKKRLPIVKGVVGEHDAAYNEIEAYINMSRKMDISTYTSRFKNERLNTVFTEAIVRYVFDDVSDVEGTIRYLDEETQKVIIEN